MRQLGHKIGKMLWCLKVAGVSGWGSHLSGECGCDWKKYLVT